MSSPSALEALPTELVEDIADYLDCKDCCTLRQVSQQLRYKANYIFLKHYTHVHVDFHNRSIAKLYAISRWNKGIAKAIKTLTIAVPNDNKWYKHHRPSRSKGKFRNACCATGMHSMVLARTLRRLSNLTEVNIAGDYLDIAHVEYSSSSSSMMPSPSPHLSRHRVVPAILHAIQQSGVTPVRLFLVEPPYHRETPPAIDATSPPCPRHLSELEVATFDYVRYLRLFFCGPRRLPEPPLSNGAIYNDFAALGHAVGLARNLICLDLHSCHPGCINETLLFPVEEAPQQQQHFPALRALRLCGDAEVSSRRLAAFLLTHMAQLTELELLRLGLSDDALHWVDLLQCVRDHRHGNNLHHFRFVGNWHTGRLIDGYARIWWGGARVVRQFELGPYAAAMRAASWVKEEDREWVEVFDEVDEWVAVFLVRTDDGEAFEQLVEEPGGMDVALDVMIEDYFETEYPFERRLLFQVIAGI